MKICAEFYRFVSRRSSEIVRYLIKFGLGVRFLGVFTSAKEVMFLPDFVCLSFCESAR